MNIILRFGLVTCLLISFAAEVSAQEEIRVSSEVACGRCRISIRRLGTLGAIDGPTGLTGTPQVITKDAFGRYVFVSEQVQSEIKLFDLRKSTAQTIGRSGAGPGEFRDVTGVAAASDGALYVYDADNLLLSIFQPDSAKPATFRISGRVYASEVLPDQRQVVNAHVGNADAIGYPLHILDKEGALILSFGAERPIYIADAPRIRRRKITLTGTGVWSAHTTQYVIEHWRLDGQLGKRLVRDADWFRPYIRGWNASPDDPPFPMLMGIHVDDAGLIWTAVAVANSGYRRYLSDNPVTAEGQRFYQVENFPAMYDTQIEIIDPVAGKVLARKKIPDLAVAWLGEDEFATYREDENGVPWIDLWHVNLDHFIR